MLRAMLARACAPSPSGGARYRHLLRELEHRTARRVRAPPRHARGLGEKRGHSRHRGPLRPCHLGRDCGAHRRCSARRRAGSTQGGAIGHRRGRAPPRRRPLRRPRAPRGPLPRVLSATPRRDGAGGCRAGLRRHRHHAFRKPLPIHPGHRARSAPSGRARGD